VALLRPPRSIPALERVPAPSPLGEPLPARAEG
jgi:hypothetical protein